MFFLGSRGVLPYEGVVGKFSFSGGACPMRGEEVTFYEEVHTPLHTKVKIILDFLYVYMYLFISMQPPGHRR